MSKKNIIETNQLTKYYGKKSRGIIDVNLAIQEGEIFGFIGPNGSGKSTAIRTLLGFIYPTSGSAKIFGLDCIKDTAAIKKEVGYLPSEVDYYDDMKIKDLLSYSAKFYGKDCSKRIKELSDIFEVDLEKNIDSLSLGNKKKVAIIQALLHSPKLLILDEPTSGLDPLMQSRFFEVLLEENQKGTTIFFSSHVLSEVQRLCHKVAIIKEGQILRIEEIGKLRSKTFKKVKIAFKESIRIEDLAIKGMENIKVKDRGIDFLYKGDVDLLIKEISQYSINNLWLEEPSLEEIFMHYYEKDGGENA
jgi:ABC-2 type transport system ATP-binding protein